MKGYHFNYDFGYILPANRITEKIYEFKLAARFEKIQYNLEWLHYKSMLIDFILFSYITFKLKKQLN